MCAGSKGLRPAQRRQVCARLDRQEQEVGRRVERKQKGALWGLRRWIGPSHGRTGQIPTHGPGPSGITQVAHICTYEIVGTDPSSSIGWLQLDIV